MDNSFLIQNIIILLLFGLCYELIFRWNKAFTKNRIYLVLSMVLSIGIPFISFQVFPYERVIQALPQNTGNIPDLIISTPILWLNIIYFTGVGIACILFIRRLWLITHFISSQSYERVDHYNICYNQEQSFSFFHYIFLKDRSNKTILSHETAHARRYHTLDKLITEILTIILWFNPIVYRFKFYITENQEFEADDITISEQQLEKASFAEYLLEHIRSQHGKPNLLTNEFHSLTKNKITMLTKSKFKSNLVYLLMLPIILTIFSAFTFKSYPVIANNDGLSTMLDTIIPGDLIITDTISNYDPVNMEERFEVIQNFIPIDKIISEMEFSGEQWILIDTIATYDYDTYEEYKNIRTSQIPIEFSSIWNKITQMQKEAIIGEYGSQSTKKIE